MARRRLSKGTATTVLVVGAVVASLAGVARAGLPLAPLSKAGPLVAAPPAGPLGPEQVPIPKGKTLADLITQIKTGNTYVNVHTKKNPDGEIRGQLK